MCFIKIFDTFRKKIALILRFKTALYVPFELVLETELVYLVSPAPAPFRCAFVFVNLANFDSDRSRELDILDFCSDFITVVYYQK